MGALIELRGGGGGGEGRQSIPEVTGHDVPVLTITCRGLLGKISIVLKRGSFISAWKTNKQKRDHPV